MLTLRIIILIRQKYIYCMVDIISRLIYWGCVPDNEESQSFCTLNVMGYRRVLFQLPNCLLYDFIHGLIYGKLGQPPNITIFQGKGILYFILANFGEKDNIFITF